MGRGPRREVVRFHRDGNARWLTLEPCNHEVVRRVKRRWYASIGQSIEDGPERWVYCERCGEERAALAAEEERE